MATPEIVEKLLAALERDNPSEWGEYFEKIRKETGDWQKLHYEHSGDYTLEMRAEQVKKCNTDLTNVDLSGKIFNSRLYSDTAFTQRIEIPEQSDAENMYFNSQAADDYYFAGLNFAGASFERAIFRGCSFCFNELAGVKAKNAVFAGCRFMVTDDGVGLVFGHTALNDARFHYCGFGNTRFPDTDLSGATFNHCNFIGHYLTNGPGWYAFDKAKLTGTQFLHCDLSQTGISREQLEQCTSIEGSKLPPELEQVRADIEAKIAEAAYIKNEPIRRAEKEYEQQQARQIEHLKQARKKLRGFERPDDAELGRIPGGRR